MSAPDDRPGDPVLADYFAELDRLNAASRRQERIDRLILIGGLALILLIPLLALLL